MALEPTVTPDLTTEIKPPADQQDDPALPTVPTELAEILQPNLMLLRLL